MVEIYCEKIRDLLADDPTRADNLPVKQDADGGMFVEGAGRQPAKARTDRCRAPGIAIRGLHQAGVIQPGPAKQILREACMACRTVDRCKLRLCSRRFLQHPFSFYSFKDHASNALRASPLTAGSVELPVTSEEQLVGVMQRGLAARAVGCTGSNAQSSRSHCLVTVSSRADRHWACSFTATSAALQGAACCGTVAGKACRSSSQ